MIATTVIEPTTAIRDWLRTKSLACGEAVYAAGLPQAVTLPALVVTAVGGSVVEPVLEGVYQFDAWATTGPAAATLAGQLISLLVSTPSTDIGGGVRYLGATCQAPIATPDPSDPDVYRYVVTAQVVTINT